MKDLEQRSLESLDWPVVTSRLAHHASTLRGSRSAEALDLSMSVDEIEATYSVVAELLALGEREEFLPFASISDIGERVEAASRRQVLVLEDLVEIHQTLAALRRCHRWIGERVEEAPHLHAQSATLDIPPEVPDQLSLAFDEHGQLSGKTYPILASGRERLSSLKTQIQKRLDSLLKSEALADVLQDRFATQRGDRWVLPIRASAKRSGLGIVHDTSRSGETVFVEPSEIVELNNAVKLTEGELRREEERILIELSKLVGVHAEPLSAALDCAERLDLHAARCALGVEIEGCIPRVGRDGVVQLIAARHPVLALRGSVVPNDLSLDTAHPALILSGPNAGGKTIALKTLGLMALLVRGGIPLPVAEGSRIDFFRPVVADIGDRQDLGEGLSTFSAHVKLLVATLAEAAPGALLLIDEPTTGTDPEQGAALAQALLEFLVDSGARVAVTTHYAGLKSLATTDERFRNAALCFEEDRPTYRLELDRSGVSHAFAIAEAYGLADEVIQRAREIMAPSSLAMVEILEKLEAEHLAACGLRDELSQAKMALASDREVLGRKLARVQEKARAMEMEAASESLERLREAEEEVVALIGALQADPKLRRAGKTLEQIRAIKAQVLPPPPVASPPEDLQAEEWVRILSMNAKALVLETPRKGKVRVKMGGTTTTVALSDLVRIKGQATTATTPVPASPATPSQGRLVGVRHDGNTLDMRGMRVEEALEEAERFLDRILLRGGTVAFFLHGHGTGALKQSLREWLRVAPQVTRWRPCQEGEGGDAFTLVEPG